jgi:putative membrane protein
MIITKNLSLRQITQFTGNHIIWLTVWMSLIVIMYQYFELKWISIPWLPVSIIGTAVAFYVGFKNNSAYDRMWEARKIWGGIVNSSRFWGITVKSFVSNQFAGDPLTSDELLTIKRKLIYRHIGWLYALRSQLLVVSPWEHANQSGLIGKIAKRYRKQFGVGLIDDEVTEIELRMLLPEDEYEKLISFKNTATQIVDYQSQDLAMLREGGFIDDFRHMELQKILANFYDHQGKCERIKKFLFPRQYANMSFFFVGIFVFLLPLGMVSEFAKLGVLGAWLSIPFMVLIGWVYVVMEIVGDYSENPFQGMANDIPMLSLCRTIENDLREMLGETNLPPAIESKKGILM